MRLFVVNLLQNQWSYLNMAHMLSKPPCACYPRIVEVTKDHTSSIPVIVLFLNIGAIFLPNQLAQMLIQAILIHWLSSPIFQSSLLGIRNTPTDLHFVQYIKA